MTAVACRGCLSSSPARVRNTTEVKDGGYTIDGNEDVVRSLAAGHYDSSDVHVAKRAMQQSAGLSQLVNAFASQIGTQQKFIGPLGPRIFRPPVQISQDKTYVDSCLGYISPIGKRAAQPVDKTEFVKTANRDFVFVLDTSGSILGSEFTQAKEAIATLVEAFCPAKFGSDVTESGTKQVSVVLFGSRVTKVIDFEDSHKGLTYLQDQIMDIKHKREGMTSTANALNFVKEAILGQGASRLKDPKVSTDVIVITDGRCNNDCANLAKEADAIRSMGQGVNVFAVGVAAARECELDIISGKVPKSSFELDGMKNFKQLADGMVAKARQSVDKCV